MARPTASAIVRRLVRAQHGVISRAQLLALRYSREAIQHRIETGRLFPAHRGVYAVGRAELTRQGQWMAAVLAVGGEAALSHESAAEHWQIARPRPGPIHVTVLVACRSRDRIVKHRTSE